MKKESIKYVTIWKSEFERLLSKWRYLKLGDAHIAALKTDDRNDAETKEICYCVPILRYLFVIYSSININSEKSRSVGSDAIRIVIFKEDEKDHVIKPALKKRHKIYRTDGWQERIEKLILHSLGDLGHNNICLLCDKRGVVKGRVDKSANFIGCVNYPECKGKFY